MSGAARYLRKAAVVLDDILAGELPSIGAAAQLVRHRHRRARPDPWCSCTGHSHILAEDLFYRLAGGLAAVNPIFDYRLMLHVSAIESTRSERLEASGEAVLSELTLTACDAMIVASNSGGNAVCTVVAAGARRAGVGVIAIVNRGHAAQLAVAEAARPRRRRDRQPRRRRRRCLDPSLRCASCRRADARPSPGRRSSTPSPSRRRSCWPVDRQGRAGCGIEAAVLSLGASGGRSAQLARRRPGHGEKGIDVADGPAFAIRGVIEGFYGTPWSDEQRLDIIDFLAAHRFNTFLGYVPKDDTASCATAGASRTPTSRCTHGPARDGSTAATMPRCHGDGRRLAGAVDAVLGALDHRQLLDDKALGLVDAGVDHVALLDPRPSPQHLQHPRRHRHVR